MYCIYCSLQYYTQIEVCQKFIHAVFLCKTKEKEEEEEEEEEVDKGFGKPKVQSSARLSHLERETSRDGLTSPPFHKVID